MTYQCSRWLKVSMPSMLPLITHGQTEAWWWWWWRRGVDAIQFKFTSCSQLSRYRVDWIEHMPLGRLATASRLISSWAQGFLWCCIQARRWCLSFSCNCNMLNGHVSHAYAEPYQRSSVCRWGLFEASSSVTRLGMQMDKWWNFSKVLNVTLIRLWINSSDWASIIWLRSNLQHWSSIQPTANLRTHSSSCNECTSSLHMCTIGHMHWLSWTSAL